MPIAAWLRGALAPLVRDTLAAPGARVAAFVSPRELRRRVAEHLAGAADHRRSLWPLLILELWLGRLHDLRSPS
jgi:asparagine synthase (glutamine-hydrolysing)